MTTLLLHPDHVSDPLVLAELRGVAEDIRVMPYVLGPTFPVDEWLKTHPHLCPACSQPLGEDRATIAQGRNRGQYHPRCCPVSTSTARNQPSR